MTAITCRRDAEKKCFASYVWTKRGSILPLFREHVVDEAMPHLFIISDEFAELRTQKPEFLSSLVSIARVGRSLGIHLILATQKSSDVVTDQISANAKSPSSA